MTIQNIRPANNSLKRTPVAAAKLNEGIIRRRLAQTVSQHY